MADVVLSEFLKSLSGNVGKVTFRNTKNGMIMATRPDRRTGEGTLEQQRARQLFTLVATQWPTLTDAQREQWEAFATTAYPRDKDGTGAGPNGQSVFNKLNWYRAVLGLSFLTSLPTGSLPAPLISVTTGEMGAEDELVFVVQHQARPGIDRLLIETTPPLPRGSLKPRDNDYRLVKGLNPTSFITVAAPGTEYRITEIRSPVPAGRRFGLRISVLTPEGMVSNPVSLVTTKIIV